MSRSERPKITKELLDDAVAGDVQAARACYVALQPIHRVRIVKVLIRTGNCSKEAVEDVFHDTFVALLEDKGRLIKAWDPARGPFEYYSGLIAEQRAIEYVRKKKESLSREDKPREPMADSSRSPESIAASKELLEKIFAILQNELEEQGSRVFELLYREKREPKEICILLDMTESAVYAWCSRLGRRIEEIAATFGGAE